MRHLLYLLLISLLISTNACRSVEKLVDQGKYDDAIVLASKKLAGKKNKKTAHVLALEEAFQKVSFHNIRMIEGLKEKNDAQAWEEVYDLARKIGARQTRLEGLLPLIRL